MISRNPADTIEYAKNFAKKLKGGEVVGLIGELGSGKTTFVKGLAEGLGISETITSPTFVILKEYNILRPKSHFRSVITGLKFVHIDAYRVENIDDIKSAGIEDYLGRDNAILVVEWAEKIKKILPKNTIYLNFKHTNKENNREIDQNDFSN
jgi:tRNA threonylcarbamoyladenosine biosynthesis protein TsaE